MNVPYSTPIVPDWFDRWFEDLFDEPAYHLAEVARRLERDYRVVHAAVMRGDLRGIREASGPGPVAFRIQRGDIRDWLLRSLVVNQDEP